MSNCKQNSNFCYIVLAKLIPKTFQWFFKTNWIYFYVYVSLIMNDEHFFEVPELLLVRFAIILNKLQNNLE